MLRVMDLEWTVQTEEAGERLDQHLARRLKLSRARARALIERGDIRREGGKLPSKGDRVEAGWRLCAPDPNEASRAAPLPRPDLPLSVLAEHADWIAVDKAPGQGVHPLHPAQTDTLLNAAVARYPELTEVGEGGLRGGVVHRLDVDTSGLLLFARTSSCHAQLRSAFAGHRVRKRYLARVEGSLREALHLDLELEIAQRRPARVRVAPPGSRRGRGRRRCRTEVQPLSPGELESLIEARPVSGYLHQIRVSLAHAGHPVLGDSLYGHSADRLWLHAWRLRLEELDLAVECPPEAGFGDLAPQG